MMKCLHDDVMTSCQDDLMAGSPASPPPPPTTPPPPPAPTKALPATFRSFMFMLSIAMNDFQINA